jgi:hypothetical protein
MTKADRLRKIFLPYFIINILAIIVYNIFYYSNFVLYEPSFDSTFINISLPLLYMIVLNVIVTFWFLKNFITPKKGNPFYLFFLFYTFSVLPLLTSIPLIREAVQSIVTVNNLSDIKDTDNQYHYKIKDYYIDITKTGEACYFTNESSRHGRKYYSMTAGFATPMIQLNNNNNNFVYWYIRNYYENTDNTKVSIDFIKIYREKCRVDFITTLKPERIVYFEKIPTERVKEATIQAIKDSSNRSNKPFIILVPHYETLDTEVFKQALIVIATLLIQIGFGLLITLKSNPKITTRKI